MPEPAPAPGGLTGGLFKKLSPKQRRYAAAVAIAMVLALIVLLGRRNKETPPAGTAEDATDSPGDLGEPVPLGEPPFQPQSTFADNGEAAGVLSSAITEGLGEVSSSLDDESQAFADLRDTLGTPAAAPGPVGKVGKNAGVNKKLSAQKKRISAQKRVIGQLKKGGGGKKKGGGGGKGAGSKKPAPKAAPKAGGGGAKKKKKK